MAASDDQTPEDGRRLSLSERSVRDIVENAVLKLQVKLMETYVSKADQQGLEATIAQIILDGKARDAKLAGLEEDKAGRDAVTSFKKWLTGGAILGTLLMAAVVVLTFYQITHPQVVHKP